MKSALIIIDIQRGLFDAEPRPANADRVIIRINNLSSNAQNADVPVIFRTANLHPAHSFRHYGERYKMVRD